MTATKTRLGGAITRNWKRAGPLRGVSSGLGRAGSEQMPERVGRTEPSYAYTNKKQSRHADTLRVGGRSRVSSTPRRRRVFQETARGGRASRSLTSRFTPRPRARTHQQWWKNTCHKTFSSFSSFPALPSVAPRSGRAGPGRVMQCKQGHGPAGAEGGRERAQSF